ncbi:MAG: FAD-dependent oxidoreductase [Candidatus Margulisiibacteriota bacterium]
MSIKNIAVVGSGISGLSAAYLLNQKFNIQVFEANHRLGGHTNTITTRSGKNIDTGFIVFNDQNYPNFCRFIDQLGVESHSSDMSFAFYHPDKNYAYSSDFPNGIFSTKKNIISPSFYYFLYQILKYNRVAQKFKNDIEENTTILDFLNDHEFNQKFINEYVLPMGAAIWSTPATDIRNFPAKLFISFWDNHHLLQILNRPKWRTIKGGSRTYIDALIKKINLQYHLNQPILKIERHDQGVKLHGRNETFEFDAVVIATHADQALKMLSEPTHREEALLGQWKYSKNKTILHSCSSIAPNQRSAWASWIYTKESDSSMCASYYMNRLQNLQSPIDYFVTLNSKRDITSNKIEYQTVYDHPMMTLNSVETQPHLESLNGLQNTFYCGSYFGNGFHEDGIRSAVAVGRHLGCHL